MPSLTSYKGLQVLTPDPIGAGGLAIQNDFKKLVDWQPKSVWSQSTDPTSGDDENDDFYPGSYWLRTDTTPPKLFVCQFSSVGAAVWRQVLLKVAQDTSPVLGGALDAERSKSRIWPIRQMLRTERRRLMSMSRVASGRSWD